MLPSVFRTLKLTMRLFYPSVGQKIRTKKRAITIYLLAWKSLLSVLSIVQLMVFLQIICCRLAEETTTKKPFSEKPISQFCFASPGYSSYTVKLHGKEGSQNNDLR